MNESSRERLAAPSNLELQDFDNIAENALNVTSFEDIPPDGGYAWVCTFCVFMINVHTWGVSSAWGVILNYFLSHSTFPNASHLGFALIGGVSIGQCLLIGPLVTQTHQTVGTMPTLLLGTVLVSAALFSASYATQFWHLLLTQGICFGSGMGFLYLTATAILPKWFSSKRSFSSGLASSGTGLGGLAYSLIAGRSIETIGIQGTYRVLAACALGANLLCSLLLRDRPSPHPAPSVLRSRRHRSHPAATTATTTLFCSPTELTHLEVLLIIIWGTSTDLGFIALLYSLPNYATSIALTPSQGSIASACLNLGLALGRPLMGYLSDRHGRITVSMLTTLVCAVLCLTLWVFLSSYPLLLLFALLAGSVCGTFWGTVAPVLTDVVGLKRLPATFGLVCFMLVAPTTVAEVIALRLVDLAGGGYLGAKVYVGGLFAVGAVALAVLRAWRFYEIERKGVVERDGGVGEFPGFGRWVALEKLFLRGRV
ncbi:MFS general substrate transporter [Aspergillus brunneoviolaceus CBS 621.78]|uniref:MFS general substrate transporter n=1 Tax=Aspergillus brunneoviolaceus CBS 621.78 TaxID=1450534 RepID=A0ACD1GPM3_9EURO|nr:MFS general substrate transporter [Aspergillus brunneoviolaceus CBS 621.78]RAH51206.1 MFS general substrate transporter [Aspergillus brunneoviolaceus CBS 621.78]